MRRLSISFGNLFVLFFENETEMISKHHKKDSGNSIGIGNLLVQLEMSLLSHELQGEVHFARLYFTFGIPGLSEQQMMSFNWRRILENMEHDLRHLKLEIEMDNGWIIDWNSEVRFVSFRRVRFVSEV